jgi:predicted Zn-dependent protease
MSLSLRRSLARALPGLALALATLSAEAASVIRDAEIEETVHRLADPIFEVAGLDAESIDIYLLNDSVLNAFVAGGQNLFINTGLIQRTKGPEELQGVIAHESGHIAGGHLARRMEEVKNAQYKALLGAAAGLVAALAGAPQAATAGMALGATFAQGGFLAFSRTQEQAADQAAVTYLAQLQESPEGLRDFFEVLETQNLRISGGGSVYARTHPLTQDRLRFMDEQVARSPFKGRSLPPDILEAHARMVAKLDGFLLSSADVQRRHPSNSIADRYARAIALYRIPDIDRALTAIDELIASEPQNPYFHELKGQVLFENGRIAEAEQPYAVAVKYRPDSSLIRLGLARALLEQDSPAKTEEAAALLREAARLEPDNPGLWRFLGIAYGKLGQEGPASMALAENAILIGNKADAQLYVYRAQQSVKPGDPEWVRLQDQLRAVEDLPNPTRGG